MTMTAIAPSRPRVAGGEHAAAGFFTRLRGALADSRDDARTLAELRALSMRQREDIGIAGLDLRTFVRARANRT